MYKPIQISLSKLIFRHPFQRSTRHTLPFQLNSISSMPTQLVPSPNPNFLNQTTSDFHSIPFPTESTRPTQFITHRKLSDSVAEFDQNKVVDEINMKCAEAREEIETSMESEETVYFDEEAECARAAVKEVLDMFDGLLKKSPEREKAALQRSMGFKIEQLKAQLEQLNE